MKSSSYGRQAEIRRLAGRRLQKLPPNRSITNSVHIERLFGSRFRSEILGIHRVVEPSDHHLFPGLGTPAHFFGWIGIELVPFGVVVVRDAFNAAALWCGNRFLHKVNELPVEIIPR